MRNLTLRFLLLFCVAATASASESWVGLNLRIQPLYIETNKLSSITWGAGAEASWFPMKRFLAQGHYSSSIFYNNAKSDYVSYYETDPSPELKPFTYWEAGAQLNLIVQSGTFSNDEKKTVQSGTKIYVDDYGVEHKVPTYKTVKTGRQFLTNEYRLIGIRGGVFGLTSGMPGDVGSDEDTIKDGNGLVVETPDLAYTNHTMSGYYVGIGRTRVFYSEGLFNTFYVDALFSSKLEYKDPVLSGFTERKVGGRVGFEGTRRHMGGRLEAGIRPGVAGFYVLAQMTFGIML